MKNEKRIRNEEAERLVSIAAPDSPGQALTTSKWKTRSTRDEQPTGQSTNAFRSVDHCLWVSSSLSAGQSNTAFGSLMHCLWVTLLVSGSQSTTAFGSVDHCLWVTSPLSTSQSTTAFGSLVHCLWVSSPLSAGQSSTEYKSVRYYSYRKTCKCRRPDNVERGKVKSKK